MHTYIERKMHTYTYIRVYIYIYIYVYICMYIHTCIFQSLYLIYNFVGVKKKTDCAICKFYKLISGKNTRAS